MILTLMLHVVLNETGKVMESSKAGCVALGCEKRFAWIERLRYLGSLIDENAKVT
jgi:hypothetical protein